MSTGLTNFKFYRSFRVRADQADKIHMKLTVLDGKDKGRIVSDETHLIDFNLFSLSFKSIVEIDVNSKIRIEIFTKKFFNKWDFEVEGKIIRSFSEKSDSSFYNYGVKLLNQNADSELKYFITDYIAGFSGKKLKNFLIKSAVSAREISTSDGVELFSLLNVLYKEFHEGEIQELIDECKHLLYCDEVRVWNINLDSDKLENTISSTGTTTLKDSHFSSKEIGMCFTTSQCINTYNTKDKKRLEDDYQLTNILCLPLLNKEKKTIGVVQFNNKLDGNFTLADENKAGFLTMVLSKYYLNFLPKSKSTSVTHLNPQLQDDFLYFGTGRRAASIRSTLKKLKYGKTNIHIVGETGLGKEFFAKELANFSKLEIYNCGKTEDITRLIEKTENLTKENSIILKDINLLTKDQQQKLFNWSQFNECQFITTTCEDLNYRIEKGLFNKSLYRLFTQSLFHVTPLRNRKYDIISIANYFLEIECKKREIKTMCLCEETQRRFRAFNWPENITQLEKSIKKSFMMGENFSEEVTIQTPGPLEKLYSKEDEIVEMSDISIHPYKLFEMLRSIEDEENAS